MIIPIQQLFSGTIKLSTGLSHSSAEFTQIPIRSIALTGEYDHTYTAVVQRNSQIVSGIVTLFCGVGTNHPVELWCLLGDFGHIHDTNHDKIKSKQSTDIRR